MEQAAKAGGQAVREKPLAIAAFHGFGANTGSWDYVYKPLAQRLRAQVTLSDMPGFGLTERCSALAQPSGYRVSLQCIGFCFRV